MLCVLYSFSRSLLKSYDSGLFAANLIASSVRMCVRACVCVTQRVLHRVHFSVSKATVITAYILVVCVTSKRERKNTVASSTASVAARLPLYLLGMTQS